MMGCEGDGFDGLDVTCCACSSVGEDFALVRFGLDDAEGCLEGWLVDDAAAAAAPFPGLPGPVLHAGGDFSVVAVFEDDTVERLGVEADADTFDDDLRFFFLPGLTRATRERAGRL